MDVVVASPRAALALNAASEDLVDQNVEPRAWERMVRICSLFATTAKHSLVSSLPAAFFALYSGSLLADAQVLEAQLISPQVALTPG